MPINEEELHKSKQMSTAMPNTSHLPTGEKNRFNTMLGGVIGGIMIALLAVGIVILHCLLSLYLCYRKSHQTNQGLLSRGDFDVYNNFIASC